ncbi:MAG: HlyD family efflux transporter periplasmic adaptor subunit [Acidobacteria bacterium]|nr:HlyD family efflux transporter periplasmic adaptor subunit [Acidobacteriota bacterium]
MTDSSTTHNVSDLDQAAIRRMAEAVTADEFCSHWLDLQARMIEGVTGGLVVLEGREAGGFAPVASWPKDLRDRRGLQGVIERTLRERKGVVMRNDSLGPVDSPDAIRQLLALPLLIGQRLHGVAALEMAPRAQGPLLAAMKQLQWGIAWLQNWILRQTAWPEAHLKHRLTTSLEMAAVILEERDYKSAATAFLTELATRLDCDRASLGILKGKRVRIQALSHSSDFRKQMNLIRGIEAAMAESLDQQAPLVYPEPADGGGRILREHEALARGHGSEAICTIPYVDSEGAFFGALLLERSQARPFDRSTMDVCDGVAAIAGPILEEKRRGGRALPVAAWESLRSHVRDLLGPRHFALKLSAAGLALLVVFFTFAKGPFRVTAKTTLQGQIRRVASSPFKGYIQEAAARAGDIVEAGALLCRLDDRDLLLERTKWSTEREQYVLEHRRSLAQGDLAAMKVLGKKVNQAEAQMALLDEQLARTRVVAPFRGLVVSGDLSQSLGAPVDAGQILFEIAPLDSYRLMLQVGEWDVSYVQPGQEGRLILTSLPDEKLPFKVTKITPVSLSEEGRSYFRVEAALAGASERLRPGMEGYAKVDIDRRRLIWIWTRDLIDWARLKIWSWWP